MTLRPLGWLTALAVLSAGCGKLEPALGIRVVATGAVAATCLKVEVLDGPAAQPAAPLPAAAADGSRSLRVGIIRGKLPATVTVRVTALVGGATCSAATLQNLVEQKDFTFPTEGTSEQTWTLTLPTGADRDGDGFLGVPAPGQSAAADCVDDPAQNGANIFPGAPSVCGTANVDFDCNGLAGCADPACSAAPACTSGPTVLAFRNNPLGAVVGACSDLLRLESRAGTTATPVAAATTVGLLAPGLTLYAGADAQCAGAPLTSAVLAANTSEVTLRFKGAAAGSFPITASAPGFTSAMQTQTVTGKSAVAVRFAANTGQAQVKAGECSSDFVLELLDVDGALAPAPTGGLSITLGHAPARSLTFYRASGCAPADALAGGSLTVAAGATSTRFVVRALGVGATQLTASLQASAPQQALTVVAGDPARLVFAPPTLSLGTNDCSPSLTVGTTDAFGNPTVTAQAVTVALDGQDPALSLQAVGCGSALAPAQVTLAAAAAQSAPFAVRASAAKTYSVKASAAGLSDALLPVSVGAGPPSTVLIAAGSGSTPAGTCVSGILVTLQDAAGQSALNAAGTTVTLSAPAGSGCTFGTDASCGGGNQLTIPANQSTATYSVRCTAAGNWTTSATFPGAVAPGTRTDTIVALSPSKLSVLTAPQTVAAGACSAGVEVEARDVFDNPAPVAPGGAPVTVGFTPNQDLTAFDGPGCTGGAVAFAGSSTRAQFSLRSNKVGSWAVGASTAFAIAAAVQHTVVPGAAAKLGLTPATAQTFAVGACGPQLTVKRFDAFDNDVTAGLTTVPLVASDGAVLEAVGGSACNGAVVSSVDISAGSATAQLLLRGKAPGVSTLTANLFAAPPSVQATVTALPADALELTPTTASGSVGASCDLFTVRSVRGGAPTPPASTLTVSLGSSTASVGLFSDATCATVATSLTITTAQSSAAFYARATAAVANATLTASAGAGSGLSPFSATATYSASAAGALTLSTVGGNTLEAGECRLVTATRAPASGNLTATLALGPAQTLPRVGLQAFSNNTCTTAAGSVAFSGNGPTATFYVKALTGGSYTATASAPTFSDGALALTVTDLVRRPAVPFNAGDTEGVSADLTAELSRSFVVFQAVNGAVANITPANANVRCGLEAGTGPGTVRVHCLRAGDQGAVSVAAQVVTLPASTGISVVHATDVVTSGEATPWNVTLGNQPRSNTFLLFSQSTDGATNAANDFWSAEYQSDTNVRVRQSSSNGGNFDVNGGVSLEAVQLTGASVDRGSLSGGGGSLSTANNLTSRGLERSFALFTARSNDTGGAEDFAMCRRRLRASFNTTQATFTRGNGATGNCTNNTVDELRWERTFLPAYATVQRTDITLADATVEAPSNGGLTAVDPTRTILLSASQGPGGQAGGETSFSTSALIGAATATFSFDNDTTVRARRGNATGTARFSVQVVTFSP